LDLAVSQADLVHFLFAFVVGTCWIFLTTWTSKRMGGEAGGFVAALPSTVVLAFAFIAWNQSVGQAVRVAAAFPMAFSITCLFPIFYAVLSRKGIWVGLLLSLSLWFGLAAVTVAVDPRDLVESAIGSGVICVPAYFVVARLDLPAQPKPPQQYTKRQMLIRAAFGGLVVMSAVLASEVGGAFLGTIFASFPAVFSATLVLESRRARLPYAKSMTRAMFITAAVSIIPYGISAAYFFPVFGYVLGSVASYCVAAVGAVLALFILRFQ